MLSPEKRYQAALQLTYSAAFDEKTGADIRKNPQACVYSPFPAVSACASLIVDALEAIEKSAGRGTEAAAVKSIVSRSNYDQFRGIYEEDGKYYICNGFMIIRLSSDIPSVAHIEKGLSNSERFFEEREAAAVNLPSAAELKTYIVAHGCKRSKVTDPAVKYRIKTESGLEVFYNVFFILDAIQAIKAGEGARAFLAVAPGGHASPLSALRIDGESGSAYILPARP